MRQLPMEVMRLPVPSAGIREAAGDFVTGIIREATISGPQTVRCTTAERMRAVIEHLLNKCTEWGRTKGGRLEFRHESGWIVIVGRRRDRRAKA